jgi:kynureninase
VTGPSTPDTSGGDQAAGTCVDRVSVVLLISVNPTSGFQLYSSSYLTFLCKYVTNSEILIDLCHSVERF